LTLQSIDKEQEAEDVFKRDPIDLDLPTRLTSQERHYLIDTLLAWIFHVFLTGPSMDDVSALMHLLSNYLGTFLVSFVYAIRYITLFLSFSL
jgi:hypothetical protein